MIAINLDWAIGLLISIILVLVITSWFRYTKDEKCSLGQSGHVVQCPYCSYVFIDYNDKNIKTCPRCESYIENKKEGSVKPNIFKKETRATVLVTVVMLIMAMTALCVGILSAMGSQGLLGQSQVDRIKADQIGRGAFWKYYIQRANGDPSALTVTETLDGKTYQAQVSSGAASGNPFQTFPITTTTTY